MKKIIICLLLSLLAHMLSGQDESVLKAALYLSGASSEEEIPSWWVEQLENQRKIRINSERLRAGCLLSDYEVACIRDYRARSGDILSFEELALVDGFSQEKVEVLRPFLTLDSERLPGQADTTRTQASLLLRRTLTTTGVKAKASGEAWRVGGAWRSGGGSLYAELQMASWKMLIGDFNARWGQGLLAWSGFSMESISTVQAFVKRAGNLSPVWSYTAESAHRGLALEYGKGTFHLGMYGARGENAGLHADWLGRNAQAGLTLLGEGGRWGVSLDGRYNRAGLLWVGEFALKGGAAAGKTALIGRWKEHGKWALQSRVLPSRYSGKKYGEYGLALGMQRQRYGQDLLSACLDLAALPLPGTDPRRLQCRIYGIWQHPWSENWLLDLRYTLRARSYEPDRNDFRSDLKYNSGPWQSTARFEAVHCSSWAALLYGEEGWKKEKGAIYLRLTFFWVPEWESRIYCYERDAPGNFSVPAYSGRGLALSFLSSCKLRLGRRGALKAYLRGACRLKAEDKPTVQVNLQVQAEL